MRSPLTLERPIGRRNFLLSATALVAAELGVKWLLFDPALATRTDALRFVLSLSELTGITGVSGPVLAAWLVFEISVAWLLTVAGIRRAIDARRPAWVASLMMVPFLRLPVIVVLALPQSVAPGAAGSVDEVRDGASGAARTALGVLLGLALAVVTVALGAYRFGAYSFGMFVLTPFFVGTTVGYLFNRPALRSLGRTCVAVTLAISLSALTLLTLAMEGAICILLAVPLAWPIALLGGLFGRAAARSLVRRRANAFAGFVILPLVLAVEHGAQTPVPLEMQSSMDIAASPRAVWAAVVDMQSIAEAPGLWFRLGVSYPKRSDVLGEGMGATRCTVFSTGVAVERVTRWEPGRHLAFELVREPPSMRELSFRETVHAPHLVGYFTTHSGSFSLMPSPDGGTRVVERTSHSLRYAPTAYWLPFVRWMVGQNHARVLRQIKRQAESATLPAGPRIAGTSASGECEAQLQ